MSTVLETHTFAEDDLAILARQLSRHLIPKPFTLWLIGPLGSGKTTLTRALLRALGLAEHVPVRSPTYTLMNEIKIKDVWYAHLDLYRLPPTANMDDLGLFDHKNFAGIFIEWPEAVQDIASITPTHKLILDIIDDKQRKLQLIQL